MSDYGPIERKNLWAPGGSNTYRGWAERATVFVWSIWPPEKDAENYVLWRTEHALVVFNKFPYNNGHLLIAPTRHIADLTNASEAELTAMMRLCAIAKRC